MTPFAEIFARAVTRKGGEAALERILATTAPRPPAEIASTPDDRILAEMTTTYLLRRLLIESDRRQVAGFRGRLRRI